MWLYKFLKASYVNKLSKSWPHNEPGSDSGFYQMSWGDHGGSEYIFTKLSPIQPLLPFADLWQGLKPWHWQGRPLNAIQCTHSSRAMWEPGSWWISQSLSLQKWGSPFFERVHLGYTENLWASRVGKEAFFLFLNPSVFPLWGNDTSTRDPRAFSFALPFPRPSHHQVLPTRFKLEPQSLPVFPSHFGQSYHCRLPG